MNTGMRSVLAVMVMGCWTAAMAADESKAATAAPNTSPEQVSDPATATTPAANAPAPDAAKKPQTICPIMGKKINKSVYVDVEGKRIYLCCKGCINAVKKDAKAIIAKMEADGIALEDAAKAETK